MDKIMKKTLSRASKVSIDGQGSVENPVVISEEKWAEILEREEIDLFILGLREEIVKNCNDICFQKYLEKQTVAFTVYCASLAFCKVLNMYNMFRDPGDTDDPLTRESWEPDLEPEPSVIDSWGSNSIEPLIQVYTPEVKLTPKKISTPSLSESTDLSRFESFRFVAEFFGEEGEYLLPSSQSSGTCISKGRKRSIFNRTLSSPLESLSLSCLLNFKMGKNAKKKPTEPNHTCRSSSESDDSFEKF